MKYSTSIGSFRSWEKFRGATKLRISGKYTNNSKANEHP